MIIALMLALELKIKTNSGFSEGNCLFAPWISSNWKFDHMYVSLCSLTVKRGKAVYSLNCKMRHFIRRLSPHEGM
jgi:hypothetical protein